MFCGNKYVPDSITLSTTTDIIISQAYSRNKVPNYNRALMKHSNFLLVAITHSKGNMQRTVQESVRCY